MSSIYTLAYASSSTYLMSNDDLEVLLSQSRKKNVESDITGILLYQDGNFLQLLEGPEKAVNDTYARIDRDRRHKGLIPLLRRSFPNRSFAGWSMGYIRNTEKKLAPDVPGFNVILERNRISILNENHIPVVIKDLILSFHRIMHKANIKIDHTLCSSSLRVQ